MPFAETRVIGRQRNGCGVRTSMHFCPRDDNVFYHMKAGANRTKYLKTPSLSSLAIVKFRNPLLGAGSDMRWVTVGDE